MEDNERKDNMCRAIDFFRGKPSPKRCCLQVRKLKVLYPAVSIQQTGSFSHSSPFSKALQSQEASPRPLRSKPLAKYLHVSFVKLLLRVTVTLYVYSLQSLFLCLCVACMSQLPKPSERREPQQICIYLTVSESLM